ncbi:MAG: transposase [Bacteriovoracaceae bacterium]|nr:transposase [Bacteriovoracaceae bacterium]
MELIRKECIWLQEFDSFIEAKKVIEDLIGEYNTERPHQELGNLSPVE